MSEQQHIKIGMALFIHGITSAKRTREVLRAVLVRESSTQPSIYSLDTCVYILTNFQVSERLHRDPELLGNYLIDYTIRCKYLISPDSPCILGN